MKNNVLASWEASLKRGGSCGVRERAVASLALQRSPPSASHIGTVLMLRNVQFVNGLLGYQTNGLLVNGEMLRTNCHVGALFANGIHVDYEQSFL